MDVPASSMCSADPGTSSVEYARQDWNAGELGRYFDFWRGWVCHAGDEQCGVCKAGLECRRIG